MKNLILLFVTTLLFYIAANGQQSKIKGNLKNLTQPKIYLNIYNGETIIRDSANVTNGHFEFTVNVKEALAARLVTRDTEKKIFDKANNFFIPALQLLFFIEPYRNVTIEGDYSYWPIATISGGNSNILLSNYYIANKDNLLKARKAMAEAFTSKNLNDSVNFKKKMQSFLTLDSINNNQLNQLAKKHPNTILAAYSTYESIPFTTDEHELKKQVANFGATIKKSVYVKAIKERLTALKASAVGTTIKDFKVTGKDSMIDIKSYRGKYVLLDFWGSWCAPCREGNPHLKKLYSDYKDKGFEIIGIAYEKGENGRENWLKAIEKDGLTWINILNDEAKEKNGIDLVKLFAVQSFPTKILIDTEGKIGLKMGYQTEELDKVLEQNFNH